MTHIISTDDIQTHTVETVGLMLMHFRNDLLYQPFYRFNQTSFAITTMVNEQFEKAAKEISSFFMEEEKIGLEAKNQALKTSILLFSDKAGSVFDWVHNHGKFVKEYSQQKDALTQEHQDQLAAVKEADRILNRIHTKFANEKLKQQQDNIKVDIDETDVSLLFEKNIKLLLDHARRYIKESVVDLERGASLSNSHDPNKHAEADDSNTITVPSLGVDLFLDEREEKQRRDVPRVRQTP